MGGRSPGRELGGGAGGGCDVGGVGRGSWEGVGRIGPMRSFSLSGLCVCVCVYVCVCVWIV